MWIEPEALSKVLLRALQPSPEERRDLVVHSPCQRVGARGVELERLLDGLAFLGQQEQRSHHASRLAQASRVDPVGHRAMPYHVAAGQAPARPWRSL